MALSTRRRRAKDRVTWTETISINESSSEAEYADWWSAAGPNPGGFEGHLSEIERQVQPHVPHDGSTPDPYSLAWYAREILIAVRRVRGAQAPEVIALTAMRVGQLYGEMRIRQAFGPAAQYVRKVKAKSTKAARSGVRDRRASGRIREDRIALEAKRIRSKLPRTPEHSTNWLAGKIGPRVGASRSTVLRHLAARRLT